MQGSENLVIFVFYFSTQNHAKISNQNKLRIVPTIKIICDKQYNKENNKNDMAA